MPTEPAPDQPRPAGVIERLEEDERLDRGADQVDRVSGVLGDAEAYSALRGDWLGHALHPSLTDVPIGFWTSATVLDVVGGRSARPAAQRLIGLGLLSVPLTALTGLADYRSVPDRAAMRVGAVHAVGNAVAALLYAESWRRRRQRRHGSAVLIGMLGGGVASFAAYLGGHLSFARGAGVGERGAGSGAKEPAELPRGDDLLDVHEAADVLTVPVEQVRTMVSEGVLTPVSSDGQPRFALSEVLATRELGG